MTNWRLSSSSATDPIALALAPDGPRRARHDPLGPVLTAGAVASAGDDRRDSPSARFDVPRGQFGAFRTPAYVYDCATRYAPRARFVHTTNAAAATKGDRVLLIIAGGAAVATKSQRIKQAMLPSRGRIRYVPPKRWNPNDPLPTRPGGGYIDRFGNEWVRGPSRTAGESFEWDVQLSQTGRNQIGWLYRDGTHVNVNRRRQVTHR